MATSTIKYFAYAHLPEKLQAVSKPLGELAELLESTIPDGPEKSAGMRKLLEAKDCFVRASLDAKQDDGFVMINGRKVELKMMLGLSDVSYEHLCLSAGRDINHNPSCTYSLPDGRAGEIIHGEKAPLMAGAIYNVQITGNA